MTFSMADLGQMFNSDEVNKHFCGGSCEKAQRSDHHTVPCNRPTGSESHIVTAVPWKDLQEVSHI